MEGVQFYDSRVQKIFSPLELWPILSLRELAEFNQNFGVSYWSVAKFVRLFHQAKLLEQLTLGASKNKLIYLNSSGQEFIFGKKSTPFVDLATLYHDYLAGKIMRSLNKFERVLSVTPEHLIKNGRFTGAGDITPDALMEVELKTGVEHWAVELELTRKTKERCREKMEKSLIHGKWNRILYITNSESIMRLLHEIFSSITLPNARERVLFLAPLKLENFETELGSAQLLIEERFFNLEQVLGNKSKRAAK